ncbi:hypothetical protein J3R83DRAFT_758 [Lanmaoa asiatica]|nr:hypothetical protein J3R83DRAFT_758 [Lanmaoa asiatica]
MDQIPQILKLLQRARASGIPFSGPESSIDTPALRALLRKAASVTVVLLKNDPAKSVPLLPRYELGALSLESVQDGT